MFTSPGLEDLSPSLLKAWAFLFVEYSQKIGESDNVPGAFFMQVYAKRRAIWMFLRKKP